MSQEYNFTPLIGLRITRLTRPQAALSIPQSIDCSIIPNISEITAPCISDADTEESLCMNDLEDHGWSFDNMLLFPTKFGYPLSLTLSRVYLGQKFKGIVSVSNSSKTHSITKVRIKATLLPQKKASTQINKTIVLNTEIGEIPANGTWSPVFEIDIDDIDSFV